MKINILFVNYCRNKVVQYEQPVAADGKTRLCMNCAEPVPGGENIPLDTTLENMRILFCG